MTINIERIKEVLLKHDIKLDEGLTEEEFDKIESLYSIKFPSSLRLLYKSFLPQFYNWRDFSEENVNNIKTRLKRPFEGIIFDIQMNGFWMECFGEKTNDMEKNVKMALDYMNNSANEIVPKLIPVYGHRYIASYPDIIDIPVISVMQTDIIYYGYNLEDYFEKEFHENSNKAQADLHYKDIPFWSEIINLNY